jgi:predicted phage terminase large subunit-like protein
MKAISSAEGIALARAKCRTYLADFIHAAFTIVDPGTSYQHNWHIDCIAEHLHAVHKGEMRRLIINMPPRSLKSISASVAFPAWLLGKDASNKVIVGSYSQDLSLKHSVDTRFLIESEWYQELFPDTRIAADQNEKRKFQTTERGHRISCSTGSAITGEGADYLIVDDPHNPLEALSDVQRKAALTWFDQTLISRQNDKKTSRIIVVMQRLHTNDLTGHLLEKGGWHHLCLPAISPQNTVISLGKKTWERKEGEYLHPNREGKEELDMVRLEQGEYAFAGQYMQTPAPEGGGEFKQEWLQYYETAPSPKGMNLYIFVDAAYEKKKESDYTAMVVVGLGGDHNYYVLDIVRDRFNPTERINALIKLHKKWNALGGKPPLVGYEKNSASSDVHYLRTAQEAINYRFPITELGTQPHKNDRIRRLVPLFQTKRVYFPSTLYYTDHTKKAIDLMNVLVHGEMLTFPVGIHPDMMDALSRVTDPDMEVHFPRVRPGAEVTIMADRHLIAPAQNHNALDYLNW